MKGWFSLINQKMTTWPNAIFIVDSKLGKGGGICSNIFLQLGTFEWASLRQLWCNLSWLWMCANHREIWTDSQTEKTNKDREFKKAWLTKHLPLSPVQDAGFQEFEFWIMVEVWMLIVRNFKSEMKMCLHECTWHERNSYVTCDSD